MLEARGDQRFAQEPLFVRIAVLAAAEQLFHRDGTAEALVHCAHDTTESTAGVLGDLLVTIRIVGLDVIDVTRRAVRGGQRGGRGIDLRTRDERFGTVRDGWDDGWWGHGS
jgi:hypothetical protein